MKQSAWVRSLSFPAGALIACVVSHFLFRNGETFEQWKSHALETLLWASAAGLASELFRRSISPIRFGRASASDRKIRLFVTERSLDGRDHWQYKEPKIL